MKKNKTLTRQVKDILIKKQAFGQSKYDDKKKHDELDKIYSFSTYKTYLKWGADFARFCEKKDPIITDVSDCRQHISDYMDTKKEQSAWTQKLIASAISKIYGMAHYVDRNGRFELVHDKDYPIVEKTRKRDDIIRSRIDRAGDRSFAPEQNKSLVDFAKSTGLRRDELEHVKGSNLLEKDGKMYIFVEKAHSKGGRERFAPVIGNVDNVIKLCSEAGSCKVFDTIPKHMDVHSYRAEYITDLYLQNARPIDEIPYDKINKGNGQRYQSQVYTCRLDRAGLKLDKVALKICSEAAGHSRLDVIPAHYLRGL